MNIFTITRKQYLIFFGALLALILVGIVLIFLYAPSMPKKITLATGGSSGLYYKFGNDFKKIMSEGSGIDVDVKSTKGSIENIELLNDPNSGVDMALVQSGAVNPEKYPNLVSIGAVFYEPYWVWYRADAFKGDLHLLSQLKNKRFAIGVIGSGSNKLTHEFLSINGIKDTDLTLLDLNPDDSLEALKQGKIDAAAFVVGIDAPLIDKYAKTSGLKIMNFADAESYVRTYPYLSKISLPQHNVSFENYLPDKDIQLVSPKAILVAKSSINPGLVNVVMSSLHELLKNYSRLQTSGEFPNNKAIGFPQQADAENYMRDGPSFLYKHLPAWLAVWVGRLLKFVLPFAILIIPLQTIIPQLLGLRLSFTLGKAYYEMKKLELDVSLAKLSNSPKENFEPLLMRLDAYEAKVNKLNVPSWEMESYFTIKAHIDTIRNRILSYEQR